MGLPSRVRPCNRRRSIHLSVKNRNSPSLSPKVNPSPVGRHTTTCPSGPPSAGPKIPRYAPRSSGPAAERLDRAIGHLSDNVNRAAHGITKLADTAASESVRSRRIGWCFPT